MTDRIAICHYRVGGTDGVSLQIKERKYLFESMGYEVKLVSGPRQKGADLVIDELEFDRDDILRIRRYAFRSSTETSEYTEAFSSELDFREHLGRVSTAIEEQLSAYVNRERIRHFFAHNIFSHGRHIAAASGVYNALKDKEINVVAVNHDLWWSGSYADDYIPTTDCVKSYLNRYVPPRTTTIKHVTLNSVAKDALLTRFKNDNRGDGRKCGKQDILPDIRVLADSHDFHRDPWIRDDFNRGLLESAEVLKDNEKSLPINDNDILVLQATRVSRRKGIELAVDLVKRLNERKQELVGKELYNKKKIDKDSRVILMLAGYVEKDGELYKKKLLEKIGLDGIPVCDLSGLVGATRQRVGGRIVYSLWDCYPYADLVTFPSLWENWGNQFLEAIFARKPIVIFEYDVYQCDIQKEDYQTISFGKEMTRDENGFATVSKESMENAVNGVLSTLLDSGTNQIVSRNFRIGQHKHDIFSPDTIKALSSLLGVPTPSGSVIDRLTALWTKGKTNRRQDTDA